MESNKLNLKKTYRNEIRFVVIKGGVWRRGNWKKVVKWYKVPVINKS